MNTNNNKPCIEPASERPVAYKPIRELSHQGLTRDHLAGYREHMKNKGIKEEVNDSPDRGYWGLI